MYDLCDYLGKDILRDLKAFNKYTDSAPTELCTKEEWVKGASPETMKKWHEIIDKMIWSFEEMMNGWEHEPNFPWIKSPEEEAYKKRVEEGFQLFGHHLKNLWY